MGFEIDYLPVGDGEKSGDAIAIRFGNLQGSRTEQRVVVIDGGFKSSGEALVEHIVKYYGTDTVDLVISTHPDSDHVSGLNVILENMTVNALMMHRPWEHAEDIKNLFISNRVTEAGVQKKLEKSLQQAKTLEDLAISQGIKIYEPFQSVSAFDGAISILGPSEEFYESLLPAFRGTPKSSVDTSLASLIKKSLKEKAEMIADYLHIDLLTDEDTTSAENNSSTIVLFAFEGQKILFTGDAGITALSHAADHAESAGIGLQDLALLDVPHHGSKRNVGSTILKRIKARNAYISAAKESTKHPAKKVSNALQKHGAKVCATNGVCIGYHYNAPSREGWGPTEPLPWYPEVEK